MANEAVEEAAGANLPPDGWKNFGLVERAPRFGYWRMTLADNSMFWSDGLYRLLGVERSLQAPGMGWLLHQLEPEDVAKLRPQIESAIARRIPFHFRARTRSQSAAARIIDTDGEIERDADGKTMAVVGVCTDATAQVTAEAERALAQERFRMMAEESSDIIVLYENGRAVCGSHALKRILDREPAQLEGGHYLDVVHPDDVAEAGKLRGRPQPGEIWTATYRARRADGQYVWLEAATRGIPPAGGVHREITVAREITERKRQEMEISAAPERAEAASRAKSLFLANMSHELRTPLNAIIGFADIMRQQIFGDLGNSRYHDYAAQIYNSGCFLLNQFRDVLDMANIEAGLLQLSFEPFDLAELVRACASEVQATADERGVALALDLPRDGARTLADRDATKQIVLNLLSNALKFTKRGGRVWLKIERTEEKPVLLVGDDGIGIPPDALDRIGRPFERACSDPYLAQGG
ncbi:MAG: PAS domain-containing sensor histidine kinase, partial [Rhizomicrobium sp.]